ncbi:STAS domain-containing protein [Skermania sp. ID1734]|uniref:STAS domain-containing protein n=1 Tax=Skermania sp. ID1734 TaxID=2597516 RepID=UPI002104A7A2|nr:STAS domain-containing protein [Skermania sp. ID1734]
MTRFDAGVEETPDFRIEAANVNGITVLSLVGALDMVTAPELSKAIEAAQYQRPSGLIIDMSQVDFLSSSGMSALVAAQQEFGDEVRFCVVADGPATSRPMRLIGLDEQLALFATLDDALADIGAADR